MSPTTPAPPALSHRFFFAAAAVCALVYACLVAAVLVLQSRRARRLARALLATRLMVFAPP